MISKSEKNRIKTKYGPWALITGASSGIGKKLAYKIGEAGLNLILSARQTEKLKAIASDIETRYGISTRIEGVDMSRQDEVKQLIDSISSMEIGLLVVSAGYGTSGEFHKTALDAELDMLQVNCVALTTLTHHFAGKFAGRGKGGGIILLSSIVGFQGVPYAANYAATKAYVQSLSEGLALELKPYGVDVLAAAPGPVRSGFEARSDMRMGQAMTPESVASPILKALGRKTTVLPGFLSKFLVGSLSLLPRWGKVRVMKLVMGGMTKHQRI